MKRAAKDYRDLCVAVSGLHTGENPQPGVPLILSLREGGFEGRIVGLSYDAMEAGIWAGLLDDVFEIPYPSEGSAAFLDRLRYIGQSIPIQVVLPTLDAEIMPYIHLVPELEKMGIRTFLPTEEQFKLRSKTKLGELRERLGIRVPRSANVADVSELERQGVNLGYPLMVKGQFYDAYKAATLDEAVHHFNKIRMSWGLPVVVQEYLKGEEYNTVAVGDGRGGCVGAVSMRKTIVTEKGKGFGGVVVADPDLDRFSKEAIAGLGWRGPLELEALKAQRDGQYYLLEVNPRFPAWVRLATGAGQNLPLVVLKLALGEEIGPLPPPQSGKFFVRHSVDIINDISVFGALSSQGELRNIRVNGVPSPARIGSRIVKVSR
jgi:carbamoyl-phosphate synthase large subunit